MNIKIGNVNYDCDKYGIVELADMQDWLQEQREDSILRKAKKVFGDNLPEKVYEDLKKEVTLEEVIASILSNIRGMAYLIWLTVKKKNPNVNFETVCKDIGDMDNATRIFEQLSPADTASPEEKKGNASQ